MRRGLLFRWILVILILGIIVFSSLASLYTDFYWFSALGFSNIFLVSLTTKIELFLVAGLLFFILAGLNVFISSKVARAKKHLPMKIKLLIVAAISFIVGLGFSANWFTVLQYFNQIPFGVQEPIFFKDVSFYVFSLPFYGLVLGFFTSVVVISLILVIINYLWCYGSREASKITMSFPGQSEVGGIPSFSIGKLFSKKGPIIHIGILLTLFFILLSVKHYLSRYSIMYSESGIVVGAGYSDIVAYLPVVKILMFLAIAGALITVLWIIFSSKTSKLKKKKVVLTLVIIYLGVALFGPVMVPGIVQSAIVSPNEINLEEPYINHNIRFTRMAYGLSAVEESDFSVNLGLTAEILDEASETIDNVRILDWRPLTKTYKQTQEIRLYYDLSGIDIDRYNIDGKYSQVMLAPRELYQASITQNAQTWVNLHMVYTHGFGIVMSPVNKVTKEGLPDFYIKDIPPVYTVEEEGLVVDTPQIYYGEKDNDYVLVNTQTQEFDYPRGNTNEYINYDGEGGVLLDSSVKKVFMALKFSDLKLLLSSDITSDSKIMFNRNIAERIHKITPFLRLDGDPYIVIDNGRLKWIVDAYTVSGNYPYSEKFGGINYIRNSVKVVVDAYDGDVTYYVMDTEDPIIMTYVNIFPQQFKKYEQMPNSLKAHIRYPEDLFKIQSQIYSTYHMDDINVFYNKEDAWQIPKEVYGVGEQVSVEPYYIIMKLPDEEEEEFVLMTSFTPIRKDNMVAWMAARSDGENYGKLRLYKFPKDKLVYGPLQIEAKIDQDSEISQQLTLWSQQGSRVTRGNLLVIPIKDSILYIEPLYIQAETGQLPELKRVLASDGERVVMEENLAQALEALFGRTVVIEEEDKSFGELVEQAQTYFELVQESMQDGNWAGIGTNLDLLGKTIDSLEEE